MILKIKETILEDVEKNGIMIHISNVNIKGISDLKKFVEMKKKQKIYHYILLLDKEDKANLFESLPTKEDTDIYFRNNDMVDLLKGRLKHDNIKYTGQNLEKLVEFLRDVGYTITDGNDYNHSFYHINVIGDFSTEPLGMTYEEIAKGIYHISSVFHTTLLEINNDRDKDYKFDFNKLLYFYNKRKIKKGGWVGGNKNLLFYALF